MNDNILKVLSFMKDGGRSTFVDMMYGGDFSGMDLLPEREGNALKGTLGEVISFQYSTLSNGTRRELQLRSLNHDSNTVELEETLVIGTLFPGYEVIIITSGDSLRGFAPVFADKLDLGVWLRDLKQWYENLPPRERMYCSHMFEDMNRLALFLYRNNPHKVASILDELQDC